MRLTKRGKLKRQKSLIILGTFSMFLFFSVGYAAFSTTIRLNARGNVHPTTTYTVEQLKSTVVTTGDGLYNDSDEQGRYVYKGKNPNNYLKINNEIWRIMSIDENNNLKIVKSEPITLPFDLGYSNSVAGVKSASSIEGTRYTNISTDFCYQASGEQSSYKGCKVWGSKDTMRDSNGILLKDTVGGAKIQRILSDSTTYNLPDDEAYLNIYLNGGKYAGITITSWYDSWSQNLPDGIKNRIMNNHLFNVGLVENKQGQLLLTDISQEKALTWQGRVGIISATDYVKASTNPSCVGIRSYISDSNCYNNSVNHNYLYKDSAQWTISPDSNISPYRVYGAFSTNVGSDYTEYSYFVRPVLYLSSDTKLSGTGFVGDEYLVK